MLSWKKIIKLLGAVRDLFMRNKVKMTENIKDKIEMNEEKIYEVEAMEEKTLIVEKFKREHAWLSVRESVILNALLEKSIKAIRPYFEKAKLKAFVTSGIRTPAQQLSTICDYVKNKSIATLFKEYVDGIVTKMKVDERIPSPSDIVLEFKLKEIYWWQRAWSRLLNLGIIINPPLDAMCLMDSMRPNGTNRKGVIILQTPHSKGTCFDVGGGKDGTPSNEYNVLLVAKRDSKTSIKSILIEYANNCVHIQVG